MEKINVAELLKDCPKGMELDCTIWDNVVFDHVDMKSDYPIYIKKMGGGEEYLTEEGCFNFDLGAKCVIFPKGKTTWEGFHKPFKDGDIVSTRNGLWIGIVKKQVNRSYETYITINGESLIYDNPRFRFERFATEKEKEKLFNAIKASGYRWNAETKTLEKLPKFKVGDRIVKKNGVSVPILITKVSDEFYYSNTKSSVGILSISEQDEWELVPNKFDITTLKPFDKVLVRTKTFTPTWTIDFYDGYQPNIGGNFTPFGVTSGKYFQQCIPYEGNEHLRGTTKDCDEFYRTWKN